jgi:molybdate transport system ATP-binding protein
MQSPKLFILENPFAGLDSASRESMHSILNELLSSGESRIILATNAIDDIPSGITHVICVSDNRVRAIGSKERILKNPIIQKLVNNNREACFWEPSRLQLTAEPNGKRLEPVIEMTNVSVRYNGIDVLHNIDWQVHAGEHWAIMGPNGAGKSTLLSLVLADNPQAYANDIRLFGQKRGSGETIWDIKRRIGWVAPELRRSYAAGFSCLQVVCSGFFDTIGLYRKPGGTNLKKANQCMQEMGIDHLAELAFHQVSEGEQRLVLICRALVKSPRLLVLDEPCMGLDDYHRKLILHLLDELCRQQIVQLLYVTHRMEEMPVSITHVLKLENGKIVKKGKRDHVLDEING